MPLVKMKKEKAQAQATICGLVSSLDQAYLMSNHDVFNWVGQNTGNLVFHHAIQSHLGGGLPRVDWSTSAATFAEIPHAVVIPCANNILGLPGLGSFASRLSHVSTHIVAIGLGAQAGSTGRQFLMHEDEITWVRTIQSKSKNNVGTNISVRGRYTKRILEAHGLGEQAVVLGCPSLFINPAPNLGEYISRHQSLKRIAVCGGHFEWNKLKKLERSLVDLVSENEGSYIVQSPQEAINFARRQPGSSSKNIASALAAYLLPDVPLPQVEKWSDRYAYTAFNVPAWLEHLRGFDFVIGTRIHGVILGLQAGIPSLCIAHDSRTEELCETMKIPFVAAEKVIDGILKEDITKLFHFDATGFDKNRSELCRSYVTFLELNGIEPVAYLREIAGAAK